MASNVTPKVGSELHTGCTRPGNGRVRISNPYFQPRHAFVTNADCSENVSSTALESPS